jgi:hypothetical protein
VPEDVKSGNPDPSMWGNPQANLPRNGDMDSHFAEQKLVLNTAFCGVGVSRCGGLMRYVVGRH